MSTKLFTVMTVRLNQDVMNPRGHLHFFAKEEYMLANKGDEVAFTFATGDEKTNPRLAKVIADIENGIKFPLRWNSKWEAFATKFTYLGSEVCVDDEWNDE